MRDDWMPLGPACFSCGAEGEPLDRAGLCADCHNEEAKYDEQYA